MRRVERRAPRERAVGGGRGGRGGRAACGERRIAKRARDGPRIELENVLARFDDERSRVGDDDLRRRIRVVQAFAYRRRDPLRMRRHRYAQRAIGRAGAAARECVHDAQQQIRIVEQVFERAANVVDDALEQRRPLRVDPLDAGGEFGDRARESGLVAGCRRVRAAGVGLAFGVAHEPLRAAPRFVEQALGARRLRQRRALEQHAAERRERVRKLAQVRGAHDSPRRRRARKTRPRAHRRARRRARRRAAPHARAGTAGAGAGAARAARRAARP
ncbi:Uncharacterised protein [Burkholderia pseudomallei]|nr:Uncharacterised protein [Burkholderia pseudomallei]CAJ3350576.1 Uncharacterised protein [Burkholderia pseudomallei]CAJ3867573.1 Uncharacterised protein [Burkholderia pseudomallei]CAJ3907912.1 Uncharacterised protein [Burkholderia pseudomallei]CAJ3909363.1 Uncharacterised protein [Burkholderia pseudomallei]